MTNRLRTTIAALAVALFLAAMGAAGALTQVGAGAPPAATAAPHLSTALTTVAAPAYEQVSDD